MINGNGMNGNTTSLSKFWELFQTSVITQSIITLSVVGAWLYMVIAQIPVPPSLEDIVALVVGFFFGSKYAQAMAQPYINLSKPIMDNARDIAKGGGGTKGGI